MNNKEYPTCRSCKYLLVEDVEEEFGVDKECYCGKYDIIRRGFPSLDFLRHRYLVGLDVVRFDCHYYQKNLPAIDYPIATPGEGTNEA